MCIILKHHDDASSRNFLYKILQKKFNNYTVIGSNDLGNMESCFQKFKYSTKRLRKFVLRGYDKRSKPFLEF